MQAGISYVTALLIDYFSLSKLPNWVLLQICFQFPNPVRRHNNRTENRMQSGFYDWKLQAIDYHDYMPNLKILMPIVFLSIILGTLYMPAKDLWFRYFEWAGSPLHEFSGCPCVSQQKRGESNLKALKPIGLSQNEALSKVGTPDLISKQNTPDVDEIWWYEEPKRILLWFKNKKCVQAYPNVPIYH